MIIVSACLAGINCRYDGGNRLNSRIREMVLSGNAIPVCPELLGGCQVPRLAAEIEGGTGADVLDGQCRVIRNDGSDATLEFITGAEITLGIAEKYNVKKAIMKKNSPSCGFGCIYDGSFSSKQIKGNGVTTQLLLRNGITVSTEDDMDRENIFT
jgi:uncharacterized protein YbbK (DUF523 family)